MPEIARQLGPRIYELSDGRIAFIGTDITRQLDNQLGQHEAARAEYERTVAIDREVLLAAKGAIADLDEQDAQVVYSPGVWAGMPDAEREALRNWACVNGINPRDVPLESVISIAAENGARVIRYERFVFRKGHEPTSEACTVPLLVEPQERWTGTAAD